jgi:5-methyltetrahydropteroyltriglutamate--homocysteine methyltransferase
MRLYPHGEEPRAPKQVERRETVARGVSNHEARLATENGMTAKLLPTTVVGSYPQPDWLVDRQLLSKGVARVRLDLWRVAEPWLEQAQDDATLLAIRDMERAGIDIITDGEMRRESYSNRFATSLEGIATGKPGEVMSKAGVATAVPRVVGAIRRTHPVETRDMAFLRQNTGRMAKITLPGPFTMSRQAVNEYYRDDDEMVMDYAAAVNAEARDLEKAGADVIQIDEPWLRQDPAAAKRIAVKAIDRALEGIKVATVVHLCFGYAAVVKGEKPVGYSFLGELGACKADQISIEAAQPKLDLGVLRELAPKKIMLGVIDLADPDAETADIVAERIRAALKFLPPDRLVPAPDCGMKYLSRELAFAKLKALADGAAIVRAEVG